MADSLHEIAIAADARKVLEAWTTEPGLCGWWTARAKVAASVGGEHVFYFDGGSTEFHFRVDELGDSRVRWTGVEGRGMPAEWVGTIVDVQIAPIEAGRTRLRFGHKSWRSAEGMYALCNTTWGELMYRLKDWCEGKGRGALFA